MRRSRRFVFASIATRGATDVLLRSGEPAIGGIMTVRALVMLNLALLEAGCSYRPCPAMPCSSSLTIEVRFMSTPRAQAYQVTITPVGGTAITCGIDTAEGTTGTCSWAGTTISVTSDSLSVALSTAPETVHVEVEADSETIASGDISPSYELVGEDCNPAPCREGTAQIAASH